MSRHSGSRRYPNPWSVWLTATAASFAAMEARALVKGDIPTLSECLARWSGVHPRRRHGSWAPVVFAAGAVWLSVHIATWGSGSPGDASGWVPVSHRRGATGE
jgi:hypothetical protein